ncbi:putative acetate kinase [Aspergillus brunneoviolaceus CBS 621.78]|uniref:Acetate kinase n=2 Tax=Aspergillus TaxID=5052 RepID=A0ACD1GFP2_9EURO|nr:acetate kinase [Aspergillus brunneoviolaceus CBS 621.78]XP_040800271.1 acetate kinase [Aspergillus fijiensis CBS 313.89]RAH48051.1 acetate kinase [Aspergillus brunneoviolaceus CBS 621.78]RAK76261.1 acetate kinase [Aspergillus fijiensis CBS 313.89]
MPRKSILSVNAGSSSVKLTFYTFEQHPKVIATAQVSGITAPPAKLKYTCGEKNHTEEIKESIGTPQDAFKFLLDRCVSDPELSEVGSKDDLAYICHRVVHGGDYDSSVVITDETYHHLEKLEDLAPLHNFSALEIIRHCRTEIPDVKSITFFDSAFHQTIPEHVRTYPIDPEVAKSKGLRKYGFHGISYSYILRSVAEFLNKPVEQTSVIAMHVGSGASMCAIKDGKSVDTTMGLTPLAGLPGATRSGDIDPSLVFHYTSEAGKLSPASTKEMHISTAEEILNKKSGWKALTGTTDFSQIAVENPPSPSHKLAFDIIVDRILGYIGNYYLKLGGKVDALVFAGGIGEKSALLRKAVIERCQCLGFAIDEASNDKGPGEGQTVVDVSKAGGSRGPRVLICQTDEQYEMAHGCVEKYGTNTNS